MSLIARGSNTDPIPQGLHLAVCYAVWDLGKQYIKKWDKITPKVILSWELPQERIVIERDGEKLDLPRVISRKYTNSLNPKADLRKNLDSWRGKVFTAEEIKGFPLGKLLGVACQLNIIHNESDGVTYANISSIVPAPKGTKLKAENPLMEFNFDDWPEKGIPEGTPDWVRELIMNSEEWQKTKSEEGVETQVDPKVRKEELGGMNKKDRLALIYKLINERSYTPPEGSKLVEDMTSGEQTELILHLEGMEGELPF